MTDKVRWIQLLIALVFAAALAACGSGGTPVAAPATVASPPDATAAPTAEPPAEQPTDTGPTAQEPTGPTAEPSPEEPPTLSPTGAPQAVDLSSLGVALETVVQGLEAPVAIAHAGDGSGRLFVVEKRGRIRVIAGGQLQEQPFLDISDRVGSDGSEQGLLGLAFPADFPESGVFFVYYTDRQGDTVVSRFSLTLDADAADPGSEEVVLTQAQPAGNHNGGQLAFGPDGYLYIGLGDGGAAGDRFGNGQNLGTWLGTVLRIDVSSLPYSVPQGNPFVGDPNALDEIWAYGLRNPWRFSFDRATGDLFIADVGQNQFEEVNVQPASSGGGETYGWPLMEGLHCYANNCDPAGLVLPFAEYSHEGGHCSVTGGFVYRGETYPPLQGVYFYADYCSGQIWGAAPAGDNWQTAPLLRESFNPASFGEDEAGEMYIADIGQGAIYRIAAR